MEDQTEDIGSITIINQLFQTDQQDRLGASKGHISGIEVYQNDQQRIKTAKEILTQGENLTADELNKLATIFLHGDSVDDYKKALELTTNAVKAGLPIKNSLISQATDRLMIQEQLDNGTPPSKLQQKYGTQTMFNKDGQPFKPPLDGTATQEELENFGIIIRND